MKLINTAIDTLSYCKQNINKNDCDILLEDVFNGTDLDENNIDDIIKILYKLSNWRSCEDI